MHPRLHCPGEGCASLPGLARFAADTCLSMTALDLGPRGPIGPLANGGFEVSYVPDDGAEHRVPITQAAWAVPLEHGNPVRRFTSRKGQRHLSGLW